MKKSTSIILLSGLIAGCDNPAKDRSDGSWGGSDSSSARAYHPYYSYSHFRSYMYGYGGGYYDSYGYGYYGGYGRGYGYGRSYGYRSGISYSPSVSHPVSARGGFGRSGISSAGE